MMKTKLIALSLISVLAVPNVFAGLSVNTALDLDLFSGKWEDSNDNKSYMLISQNKNILDVNAVDSNSLYHMTCVIKKDNPLVATCVGDGVMKNMLRFIYRSEMKYNQETGGITEKWEYEGYGGVVKGETIFKGENYTR